MAVGLNVLWSGSLATDAITAPGQANWGSVSVYGCVALMTVWAVWRGIALRSEPGGARVIGEIITGLIVGIPSVAGMWITARPKRAGDRDTRAGEKGPTITPMVGSFSHARMARLIPQETLPRAFQVPDTQNVQRPDLRKPKTAGHIIRNDRSSSTSDPAVPGQSVVPSVQLISWVLAARSRGTSPPMYVQESEVRCR